MSLLGSDFVSSDPTDTSNVSQGAAYIRDIKQRLKDFVAVCFDPETGQLLPGAVPGIPTPGDPGTVLTSTGPDTNPVWGAGPGIPIGCVLPWAGATIPSGYLECDGSSKLIADFPALATSIGTNFGGDGVSTFRVPDCRGRTLVGAGTGDAPVATAWGVGDKKGTESVVLTAPQIAAHTHKTTFFEYTAGGGGSGTQNFLTENDNSSSSPGHGGTTDIESNENDPADTAHTNLQPSIGVRFIIKS